MYRKIDISHKTVFFIVGFIALLWALYQIREVIVLLFIAIILMSAILPVVERLERMKVPKAIAIAGVYIVILALIATLVSLVVTPLLEETSRLNQFLPQGVDQVLPPFVDRSILTQELQNFTHNAVSITLNVFSQFLGFISVAVLTFYLLLERDKLDHLIAQFFLRREDTAKRVVRKIEEKLGSWFRGQVVLSFIIGIAAYIALLIIQVPFALPLAILAGIMEVVPVIGPIISAVPAVLIAYVTLGPVYALFVALAFFIIQQLENHVVAPQVMKKAVGLNPLIVILAVAIGGKLLGVAGALLAVPIAVVVEIVADELIHNSDDESSESSQS